MREKWFYRSVLFFYVLVVYAFIPEFHFYFTKAPHKLYQFLTQSFLSGQLSLLVPPSPELLSLANPYDPAQNAAFRLYDASLFQEKYYLYFGPLPVLLFYLPLTWLTGYYPSESFALFFFLLLGFIVNMKLIIKIKEQYFPRVSELSLTFVGFLLAFANGTPFLFSIPRIYEVAIAAAYSLTSLALFFLYRALNNDYKTKDIFLFGFFLAATVACRFNFALVCSVLLLLISIHLSRHTCGLPRIKKLMALFFPALVTALLLGLYNYLRFHSIFDFGHYWQLSCNNLQTIYSDLGQLKHVFRNMIYSFYFYFLSPFSVSLEPPFFGLRMHGCLYHIDTDYNLEAVAGILTTMPFILVLLALPKLIAVEKKQKPSLIIFLQFALLIPLINALFFILMPFAIQRYNVDFVPYFVLLAVICYWLLQNYLRKPLWLKMLKVFFISTSFFSIVMGISLCWAYWILV